MVWAPTPANSAKQVSAANTRAVTSSPALVSASRADETGLPHGSGHLGAARLALTRAGDDVTARVFAALTCFAEFAGVGAQTTHGFGAVRLAEPHDG